SRRNGACFSIALTTAHAIIALGEGAAFSFDFLAESRAFRITVHSASICRFAGITRESLRVIVGDNAGSQVRRLIAGSAAARSEGSDCLTGSACATAC